MKTNRLIAILMIVLMLSSSLSAVFAEESTGNPKEKKNTVNFTDITKNYGWAKDAIESFAEQGIVKGTGDGKFSPGEKVTREQFATMLALTFDAPLTTPVVSTFSDVPATTWSYQYIEACKEFLTGYANPFGGKPSFRPTEPATREDIAVALVKIMGLSNAETQNTNYAQQNFKDANEISPGLMKYVSIAAESGLIQGKGDGKLEPLKSITRAETVVMLDRATKQAMTSMDEIMVSANIESNRRPEEVTLSIKAEKGTKVTVDGVIVIMYAVGEGYLSGTHTYKFEKEGDKIFKIEATKDGKKKSLEVTATYNVDVPTLNITTCPTSSSVNTATISGNVKDAKDRNPSLTVNGRRVPVLPSGEWTTKVALNEGENKIAIVATNSLGKSATVEKVITFGAGAPTLSIIACPTTSSTKKVTITGNAKDANDDRLVVTINGKSVYANYSGDFSQEIELTEGVNKITIVATNDAGKSATVERTITFNAGAPTLVITACPTVATTKTVTIAGNTKDANDRDLTVTINGEIVHPSWDGSWTKNVTLNEGENKFTIVSTNDSGLSTTVERTITFNAGAPTINIISCPDTSTVKTTTIAGNVKDSNNSRVTLTINGSVVFINSYGEWRKEVSLNAGENKIVIVATNEFGKSTTVERTINYISSTQTPVPTPVPTPTAPSVPTTPTTPTAPTIEQQTTPTTPATEQPTETTAPGNTKNPKNNK